MGSSDSCWLVACALDCCALAEISMSTHNADGEGVRDFHKVPRCA
eukprot:SAG31_NODE_12355_length_947_cov_61.962264_1_plen_44_part_10